MNTQFLFGSLLLACTTVSSESHAAFTLASGGATIDYHAAAWATVAGGANSAGFEALILDEYFNQAGVTSRTNTQILNDEVQANPPYTGQLYQMNGTSVSNLAGRTNQATTFSYNVGTPTAHTGVIGLGGMTRWDVNPLLGGGNILFGDFTLQYDANRLLVGGSGWALTGNVSPASVVFDLLNVVINATDTSFDISGDLGVSYEVANFLFATPTDQGKDVGNFSFSATAVPEPSRVLLLLAGLGGVGWSRRRRA
ncbi:MAG: PEP-CTERM sorting domain-containing protein [Roseimicrobium sp.]